LRPFTRTSFHHQPEAQHPKSSAIHKLVGRLPHLVTQSVISGRSFAVVHNRIRLIWSGGPFPVGSTAGRKSSDH
jgi:hypothetical protein